MKKFNNILSAVVLVVTFILVITFVFTRMQGKTPQLLGHQILRISSSSMEPVLEVEDIILSKRVKEVTTLEVGDIITDNVEVGSYEGKVITHELAAEPYMSGDKYYLQTRGIANGYTDPEISEDQVIGKMIRTLPTLSVAFDFFVTPWGLAFILLFLLILFINELFHLSSAIKEKKQAEKKQAKNKKQVKYKN